MSEPKKPLPDAAALRRFRDNAPRPGRVLLLLALLAALGFGLFFLIRPTAAPEEAEPPDTRVKLIDREKAALRSITVTIQGEAPYTLLNLNDYDLSGENDILGREYAVEGDADFAVSTAQVLSMERYATELTAEQVAVRAPEDLGEYGLKQPAMTVSIGFRDGAGAAFDFGIEAPTGDGVYLRMLGESDVCIVDYAVYEAFDRTLESLRQTDEEKTSLKNAREAEAGAVAPDAPSLSDEADLQDAAEEPDASDMPDATETPFQAENPLD